MPIGVYIKSPEHKKKISDSLKELGIKPICRGWSKGKKLPEWIIKKLSGKNNHNYGKDFSGNKAPNWQGGRRLSSGGYILICSPHHKFRNSINCVVEHRLIMEQYLKRYLKTEERVHHINGNKVDNRLSNLKLFANDLEHLKFHYSSGSRIGKNQYKKEVNK